MTEEQSKGFLTKHYELLQKQWKEHADRFVLAAASATGEKSEENYTRNANAALKEYLENIVFNNRVRTFSELLKSDKEFSCQNLISS